MEHLLTKKEFDIMTDQLAKVKHTCSCGHRVVVPQRTDKEICSWCGHYVFREKRDEFKYRVKEKMR